MKAINTNYSHVFLFQNFEKEALSEKDKKERMSDEGSEREWLKID